MEQLRRELRGEIVAAAQRGNQALDQAQRAQEAVAAVRRRLDATGAALSGAEEPAGAGRARVSVPEPDEDAPPARSRAASAQYGAERPAAGVYGAERAGSAEYGGERGAAAPPGVYGASRPPEQDSRPEPAPRPVGMVRHTETVHVTTRHTIVDGGHSEPTGVRYGGGYTGGWSPGADERSWGGAEDRWSGAGSGPEERSWSGYAGADERSHQGDERSRPGDERRWAAYGDSRDEPGWDDPREDRGWAGRRDERSWSAPAEERSWPRQRGGAGEAGWDDPEERADRPAQPDDTGQYWSQLRAGDRWASVRDDDRGQELRMGERRAEVHADASGTEYRVADRWASVRRDEPRRDEPRWDDPPRDEPRTYGRGGDAGRRAGWAEPEERAALPAGGVPVPDEWRPPRQRGYQSAPDVEPERVGRRARADEDHYGYPPHDDAPRAGGTRWR
ncbi:hypothetical protein D7193_21175 [Micromonospora costi]|uniref:Uncharacterized protein n=2 Tax=Micromonospora costi TaxID=1530042 RepID=A0A3B0A247_9ACTN|nr:hypothetical protein D7193_21175 [Micromonospora costi]